MKAQSTIRRELKRVEQELKRNDLSEREEAELYGAMTALSWALGQDTMAPAKAALITRKKA